MVGTDVEAILNALPTLPLADLRRIGEAAELAAKALTPKAVKDLPDCPRCGAGDPYRWGSAAGSSRWRCKTCLRTFTEQTGTPLAFAKKRPAMLAAAADMLEDTPRSCRKLAMDLGVHRMTIWRWRINALRSMNGFGDAVLAGLVEADETFFRESRKGSREWANFDKNIGPNPPRPRWRDFDRNRGAPLPRGLSRWQIPILVLRDRHGATQAQRLDSLKFASFEPVLNAALAADAMLCTDGGAVYRRWAKVQNRKVEQVNTRKGIRVRDGVFHVQNANAFHSRLKAFIRPFHGPSTRHLPLYVGWMTFRDHLCGTEILGNPLIERLRLESRRLDPTRKRAPPLAVPGGFNI